MANRNSKIEISTAPTKVKSLQKAYSQALVQTKLIGRGHNLESGRQMAMTLWWMVFGAETGREVGGRRG